MLNKKVTFCMCTFKLHNNSNQNTKGIKRYIFFCFSHCHVCNFVSTKLQSNLRTKRLKLRILHQQARRVIGHSEAVSCLCLCILLKPFLEEFGSNKVWLQILVSSDANLQSNSMRVPLFPLSLERSHLVTLHYHRYLIVSSST